MLSRCNERAAADAFRTKSQWWLLRTVIDGWNGSRDGFRSECDDLVLIRPIMSEHPNLIALVSIVLTDDNCQTLPDNCMGH